MRQNPQLSLPSLQGGFPPVPGEEKSSSQEEHKPEEELIRENQKITKKQKNIKSNKNSKTDKHKSRVRRGGVHNKVNNVISKSVSNIKMFSTNGAGIKNGKVDSLNAEIQSVQANIITVQETHCRQKGKIKMDSKFVIFEAIRKRKLLSLKSN